jgi:hypothetical protein
MLSKLSKLELFEFGGVQVVEVIVGLIFAPFVGDLCLVDPE